MGKFTVRDLMVSLREGRYSSVGSYPKYWVTADGDALSHAAVMENLGQIARTIRDYGDKQWLVVGCEVNWENAELFCDHSGERIESAYAEAEVQS